MADDSTSAWPRKSDIPCDVSEYTDDSNPWDPDLDEGFGLNQFIGMIDPNEELHVVATVQAVPMSRSATGQKTDIETSTSQAPGAGDAQMGDAQVAALHAAIVARISARLSGLPAKQPSGDEEAENEKPSCAPTSDGTGLTSTKSSACDPMSAGSTQSSATLTASSSQRSSLQSSNNISAKKQSAKPQLLKKMKTLLQDVKEFARTATLLGH